MKKLSLFLVALCLANKTTCMDLPADFYDSEDESIGYDLSDLSQNDDMVEDVDIRHLQIAYEAQQKREQYLQQQAKLIEDQIKAFKLKKQQKLESELFEQLAQLSDVEITAFDQFGRQYQLNLSDNVNKESIMAALAEQIGQPVHMLNFVNLAQPNQRFVVNFDDHSLQSSSIYAQAPNSYADTIYEEPIPQPSIYNSFNTTD